MVDASSLSSSAGIEVQLRGVRFPPDLITLAVRWYLRYGLSYRDEDSRAEVLAARQGGDEQVEQALVSEWQGRLRRLVAADPHLADELRRMVAELRPVLADADPPQHTTITMQATTFDTSRVNQAGRDLHITTGE